MLSVARIKKCTTKRVFGSRPVTTLTEKRGKGRLITPFILTSDREPLNFKVGDKIHGYVVSEIKPLPERNLTAVELHHEKTGKMQATVLTITGARHLHLDCEDTNNVFMITFKTSPTNSTGVAHVLEHTALCGSQKYPIRDPFFNMLKRSVQTYMNAWTGIY